MFVCGDAMNSSFIVGMILFALHLSCSAACNTKGPFFVQVFVREDDGLAGYDQFMASKVGVDATIFQGQRSTGRPFFQGRVGPYNDLKDAIVALDGLTGKSNFNLSVVYSTGDVVEDCALSAFNRSTGAVGSATVARVDASRKVVVVSDEKRSSASKSLARQKPRFDSLEAADRRRGLLRFLAGDENLLHEVDAPITVDGKSHLAMYCYFRDEAFNTSKEWIPGVMSYGTVQLWRGQSPPQLTPSQIRSVRTAHPMLVDLAADYCPQRSEPIVLKFQWNLINQAWLADQQEQRERVAERNRSKAERDRGMVEKFQECEDSQRRHDDCWSSGGDYLQRQVNCGSVRPSC